MLRRRLPPLLVLLLISTIPAKSASALVLERYVLDQPIDRGFALFESGRAATIVVDPSDWPGVNRVARDLQADIKRVSGIAPSLAPNTDQLAGSPPIIVGCIGKSSLIDGLVKSKKLDTAAIAGKWESYITCVVDAPMPGVERALVIVGSDKRGTIYGVYELSEQIGVSPWYWWADVPPKHRDAIYIKPGGWTQGPPGVTYRGIFLNDEAPALTGWAKEKFGGLNHEFYSHVFELILRLRGNYLWPAMWGNSFFEDDPLNAKTADEYGIVMGTSHHEPMMRAHQDWTRRKPGEWNYATNEMVLRKFWEEGIERNKDYETITTIGMRGDGDKPMVEGGDVTANQQLLERIVADQRKMIAQKINPDVTKVPQIWALYKEVQDYYDHGMRVPDDVTLLWCDDNWGNIRRLPTPDERQRVGGAGVYYHFDYVGGPRNYKWINTNPLPKIWEQMNLAYEYDAKRIWIVNVGDLKPMELPIEFFLSLAWSPQDWPKEKIGDFTKLWAAREFGQKHADEIADVVSKTLKYNGRRKPELLEPGTFSLTNYDEAERIVADWNDLAARAQKISDDLPDEVRDAFYELVLHPALASATVNELYVTVAKNRLFAGQHRASANALAQRARELFKKDQDITNYYNTAIAGGKWSHMMDQTHIGYTSWRDPPKNVMPEVKEIELGEEPEMGIAVEESDAVWPDESSSGKTRLPTFDQFGKRRRHIDVFSRGKGSLEFEVKPSKPWIVASTSKGTAGQEDARIWVEIDWSKVPADKAAVGSVHISQAGGGKSDDVIVAADKRPESDVPDVSFAGHVESARVVSIEAEHFTRATQAAGARWEKIEDYGRTLSGMSIAPVNAPSVEPPSQSPCLEYDVFMFSSGELEVSALVGPTLDFVPGRGLRLAVSFDDRAPQVIDVLADKSNRAWEESVKDSIRVARSKHTIDKPGKHTLKIWMVDPGVVLEKIVIDSGGLTRSYLGPPESPIVGSGK